LVKQFRGFGIRLLNSTGGTVVGVTTSTNCFSGIFVTGGSGHRLDRNVAVRNGNVSSPCGGI
jgi:parallel beta-helix repeat protein